MVYHSCGVRGRRDQMVCDRDENLSAAELLVVTIKRELLDKVKTSQRIGPALLYI